jgi:hypothetical protein
MLGTGFSGRLGLACRKGSVPNLFFLSSVDVFIDKNVV